MRIKASARALKGAACIPHASVSECIDHGLGAFVIMFPCVLSSKQTGRGMCVSIAGPVSRQQRGKAIREC